MSRKKRILITVISFVTIFIIMVLYVVLGATLPYLKQPEAGDEYKKSFNIEMFYGTEDSEDKIIQNENSEKVNCDRAAIIDDNGDALKERIRLIANAKESIILSTYEFRSDTSGKQVISALKDAAERGVDVKLLIDGICYLNEMKGDPYFQTLAAEDNVHLKIYNPINIFVPWNLMSRMHDKYIIADDLVYILGGRNTFDYFLGDGEGYKNYDRDVLVVNTGSTESSVYQMKDYFEKIWSLEYCKVWDGEINTWNEKDIKEAETELKDIFTDMKEMYPEWFEETDYKENTVPTNKVTLISNPTNLGTKEAECLYALSELMKNAEEVVLHTPYIICNEYMYEVFSEISESTDITLMTNSSANNGNVFGATDYVINKQKILDTGMKVMEYDGEYSYHAKSILIDDDISIVGTFNMDMKSAYQNTEVMLVIHSEELNSELREKMSFYHENTTEAAVQSDKMAELLHEDVSLKKKVLRLIIWVIDPFVRFLF